MSETNMMQTGVEFTLQRMMDLIRYMRAELHEGNYLTDDEYAALAMVPCPFDRLESYDDVRGQLTTALARAERAERERDELKSLLRAALAVTEKEQKTLETRNRQLVQAASGMLEYYLKLKRISLAMAYSDAPNWMGGNLTPDDDVHVIAVRKVLGKP